MNQIARRRAGDLQRVLDLRERLRASSSGDELRRAGEERRALITRLTRQAESILRESGHAASAGTLQAIAQTLHGAEDATEREALRRGRLTRELQSGGLDALSIAPDDAPEVSPRERRAAERKAHTAAVEAAEAEREARRLDEEARDAEAAARTAAERAAQARRRAAEARAAAKSAERDVGRL